MAGIGKVMDEVKKAVVGKDAVLLRAVLAILAGGHILLEDVPGVGKTTMALAFSKALGLRYNRMQFTPDVLPSDVTGFSLYNKAVGKMEYQPGAVLCNLFLADELNRATSRTQAALLEAMEEGVGKTTMALAFSKALGLRYNRMQFTPDVLPSDVTGFSLYNKAVGKMEYQPGAVLCNLFLADELNRATSRTQAALLEAMEEGQVTVDGVTHALLRPFIVIATQNPAGASGTQLLPDSQLDRFMVKLSLGYPEPQDELRMLRRKQKGNPLDGVQQALDKAGLAALRAQTDQVYVSDEVLDYIVRLVAGTRTLPELVQGASPRATLAVAAMAKAAALARGADYVTPADVRRIFHCTVAHRLLPAPQTRDVDALLDDLMRSISAPQLK